MVLDTAETFRFTEESGMERQHMMSNLMGITLAGNIVAIDVFNPRDNESRSRHSEFPTPEDASIHFDHLTVLWNKHLKGMRPD